MTYKDQLEQATNDNQATTQEHGQSIAEDIKQIFNDDTLFGELMTEVVGQVVGNLAEKTIETLQEKFNDVFQSDDFSGRLGEQLDEKYVDRPPVNIEQDQAQQVEQERA